MDNNVTYIGSGMPLPLSRETALAEERGINTAVKLARRREELERAGDVAGMLALADEYEKTGRAGANIARQIRREWEA